jgi:hypothetical protein
LANGVLGRAARPPGQLWQVPTFIAGVVALVLVAATAPLAPQDADNQLERDLGRIRQVLERPETPGDDLVALAESAVARSGQQPELAGEAHFLLGSIHLRISERCAADRQKEEREKAALHLKSAELHGVAPTDRARLQYLLGKLLFLSGGDLLRVIDLLSRSLPDGADNIAEGYGLLVQAHLKKAVPDIDAALVANLKQMQHCDDDTVLNQARLLRGELLLKKEMRTEAIKVLEQVGGRAPQPLRLKARALLARAATEEGLWARAIGLWRELLPQAANVPGGRARIQYFLGYCLLQERELPSHQQDAIAAWQDASEDSGEEGQAAAIRLAEVHLSSPSTQIAALDDLRKGLKKVFTPNDFRNKLIEIQTVRDILEEACRIFNEQQDAEHFLQAAQLYKRLSPPGTAEEKIAEAARARGLQLLKDAEKAPADKAGTLREEAYTHLQNAALAYEKAAESRPGAEGADALWHCVECYRLVPHEPQQTMAVLRKFVELPLQPESKAEAWFTLGEMQRQLNQPEAVESYKMCVACNNEVFANRARLQLADLAVQKKELDDAEQIYQQIIKGAPVVDRPTHERAMWKLARLLFDRQKYGEAAVKCSELFQQYPAHPQVLSAQELWGECYRLLAADALKMAETPEVQDTGKKPYYLQQWRDNLERACDVYQQLADELEARAKGGKALPPVEEALWRKAQFVVADCYFDLPNNLDVAFQRYQKLFQRYSKDADGLWACKGLYGCFFYASQAYRHPNLELMRFAAEDAVETCLRQFNDYVQADIFTNDEHRLAWQQWLQKASDELQKSKQRSGGD